MCALPLPVCSFTPHTDTPMHTQHSAVHAWAHAHTGMHRCMFTKRLVIPSVGLSVICEAQGQGGGSPAGRWESEGEGTVRAGRHAVSSVNVQPLVHAHPSEMSPHCSVPIRKPRSRSWSSRFLRGHLRPRLHICRGTRGSRPLT